MAAVVSPLRGHSSRAGFCPTVVARRAAVPALLDQAMSAPQSPDDLTTRDRRVAWHPFTQHGTDDVLLPVRSAHGAVLVLEDGREIIDAVSSWWTCLHG